MRFRGENDFAWEQPPEDKVRSNVKKANAGSKISLYFALLLTACSGYTGADTKSKAVLIRDRTHSQDLWVAILLLLHYTDQLKTSLTGRPSLLL